MSNELPWPQALRVSQDVSWDAVVVVPGIMGSELIDAESGATLWGLRRLGWYVRAWTRGEGLAPLAVTDDELAGRTGRVKANGLLRFPAFAPLLAGVEPYLPLVTRIRQVVAHRDAVLEFGYDWRLPVAHNAGHLATAAAAHLDRWRARSGRGDARLVLVAHSMGGLLCRALPADSGITDDIRTIITLGTPFDGAGKAAVILNSGQGAPLPAGRLQALAAGMPGIHDLLPTYRCVDEGDTVRALTPADVGRLGGSADLAQDSFAMHRLARPMAAHRALIGIQQPTLCSLTLRDGEVTGQGYTLQLHEDGEFVREPNGLLKRLPGLGDGTVPRNSANPLGTDPLPLAQQHGALAVSGEALDFVCDVLRHASIDRGPRLGDGEIGLDLPDITAPGVEWTATITGAAPHQARCVVTDADTHRVVDHPLLHRRDGHVVVAVTLPEPGLYRVSVTGGGTSAVSQLVLAGDTSGAP